MFSRQMFAGICTLLLLMACSNDKISGTSETTNQRTGYKGLYGKLVDVHGKPVPGTIVKAVDINRDTLAKTTAPVNRKASDTDSVSTDDSGYYSFESLEAGTYNIEGDYNNGDLVVFITGIEYDSTGKVQEVATDTLRAPGQISGRVNTGTDDDGGVLCYIPGTSFLAVTDDSGSFTLSDIPEGIYTITYRKDKLKTVSDTGIEVLSGEETQVTIRDMEADPEYPPPVPGGLSVSYDTLHGCAILTWNPVAVEDLAGYAVFRNDTSAATPRSLGDELVKDTFYIDTIFKTLNDTISRTLAYRIKAQDEEANLSTVYSKAVIINASPLKTVRTFINFHMLNTLGDDTASINDTVTIIASYGNATRKNVKLQWFDGENDSLLRETELDDYSGDDTLSISWSEPSEKEIYVLVTDDGGSVWRETGMVIIYNYTPVITAIRNDTTISIGDSILFFVTGQDRDGTIEEYTWDFDGDGTIDVTDDDSITGYRYMVTGTFKAKAGVIDDDNEDIHQIITVKVVQDVPVADAGNGDTVFSGDTVWLHGSAKQQFGEIVKWEWKIDDEEWTETAGPDTFFITAFEDRTVLCSLRVTDDDDNSDIDEVEIRNLILVKDFAAGQFYSLFLKADNTLWTCGNNEYGQLGIGKKTKDEQIPIKIMNNVKSISAGAYYTLIILNDNTLWACGQNKYGQLGDGTTTEQLTPVKVLDDVQSVSAGYRHSIALRTNSTVSAFGYNEDGELGYGKITPLRTTPVQMKVDNVINISAGGDYSLLLKDDETLWGCGYNMYGQLGGATGEKRCSTPVQITNDVQDMYACYHTLIQKTDGSLWTCGTNEYGQLGQGVKNFDGFGFRSLCQVLNDVKMLAAGDGHSLALKTDNTLWGFGSNIEGQLGVGSKALDSIPFHIMNDVKKIASSYSHSLILKTDGTLWACGLNRCGELGDGTAKIRRRPVQIILPEDE